MGQTIPLDQPGGRLYTRASRQTDLFASSSNAPGRRPLHNPAHERLIRQMGRLSGALLLLLKDEIKEPEQSVKKSIRRYELLLCSLLLCGLAFALWVFKAGSLHLFDAHTSLLLTSQQI